MFVNKLFRSTHLTRVLNETFNFKSFEQVLFAKSYEFD